MANESRSLSNYGSTSSRRAASSEDSGSSSSNRRGWRSSARPSATRCFSPPDNSCGRRASNASSPSSADDVVEADLPGRAARQRASCRIRDCRARRGAETGARPGTPRRCGDAARRHRCRARCRAAPRRPPARARIGRQQPAISEITVDLPQPERPNSAVTPGVGALKSMSSEKSPRRLVSWTRSISAPQRAAQMPRAGIRKSAVRRVPAKTRSARVAPRARRRPVSAARCTARAAACASRRECWMRT